MVLAGLGNHSFIHQNLKPNLALALVATGHRCPACWPQCPQKMQKSMPTSGLPSISVFFMITKVDNNT